MDYKQKLEEGKIQQSAKPFKRRAVTTFCNNTGALFVEKLDTRGKMIIKPNKKHWITSPHRAHDYMFEQTNRTTGGVYWHFTGGFRLSATNIHFDGHYNVDSLLKDLTLSMLQNTSPGMLNRKWNATRYADMTGLCKITPRTGRFSFDCFIARWQLGPLPSDRP